MRMFGRRLQLLLDDARYQKVAAAARARGVSIAAVIREAIDHAVPSAATRRSSAARTILDAPDMPVPDPPELRRELEDLRGRVG
jgi:hypothetical protein